MIHTDTVGYEVESLTVVRLVVVQTVQAYVCWAGSFPTNYEAILPLMVLYRVDHPIGHLSYSPLPASAACSFLHARFDVPMTSTVFGNCTSLAPEEKKIIISEQNLTLFLPGGEVLHRASGDLAMWVCCLCFTGHVTKV